MKQRLLAMALATSLTLSLAVGSASAATWVTPNQAEQTVMALGIMEGNENGYINWGSNVSRAEFTKMLLVASPVHEQITNSGTGYSLYRDVKSTHWASGYIKLAVENQYLIGYTDGTFRPDVLIPVEQAYTAVMKMLGYDTNAFTGVYPAAQMNKAAELGLSDGITAVAGQAMTRQECARLFYNLMEVELSTGMYYGTTIDCPIVAGEVDYLQLIEDSLEGPYVYQSGTNLPFVPTSTYVDGLPANGTSLQSQDVYYYNDFLKTLWIYTDSATGTLTARGPSSTMPTSLTVGGKTYALGTTAASYQASSLQGVEIGDTLTLLLGLDDVAVAVLPADHDVTVDYDLLVQENLKGPYIWDGSDDEMDFTPVVVYDNGTLSSLSAIRDNDVYYFNELAKTVWIHTETVTGNVDALLPTALAPTSVVLSGVTYPLSSNTAKYQLSALNGVEEDDCVTLLLGLDGGAVGVVEDSNESGLYYGVVQSYQKSLHKDEAKVETTLTITATDGENYTFKLDDNSDWDAGDLVVIQVSNAGTTVGSKLTKSLSGTVNSKATQLGSYDFADDVQMIDTYDNGKVLSIKPSRLAGATLKSADVRYYVLNGDGEISHLILDEVTGDGYAYGYITEAQSYSGDMMVSGMYTYVLDGVTRVLGGGTAYNVSRGGAIFAFERDGSMDYMKQLTSVSLSSLSDTIALGGQKEYAVSDDVAVYVQLEAGGDYTLVDLDQVDDASAYTLTGWYDSLSFSAGGQIRVVTAKLK